MRGLAEDQNIIIQPTDKGSCVVGWDREYYLAEAGRQPKDNEAYERSSFKDAVTASSNLLEKGNLLLKKNLSISLINIRRSPILGKCTYCLRSISV